jgi:type I restriction enzyme S subunit
MVEWENTTIGKLLAFKNGLNKSKEFFGQGTPIVNYMDVYKNRGIHAKQLLGKVTLSVEEIKRFDVQMSPFSRNEPYFRSVEMLPCVQ